MYGFGWIVAGLLIAVVLCVIANGYNNCQDAHGAYVRTAFGYTCVEKGMH